MYDAYNPLRISCTMTVYTHRYSGDPWCMQPVLFAYLKYGVSLHGVIHIITIKWWTTIYEFAVCLSGSIFVAVQFSVESHTRKWLLVYHLENDVLVFGPFVLSCVLSSSGSHSHGVGNLSSSQLALSCTRSINHGMVSLLGWLQYARCDDVTAPGVTQLQAWIYNLSCNKRHDDVKDKTLSMSTFLR